LVAIPVLPGGLPTGTGNGRFSKNKDRCSGLPVRATGAQSNPFPGGGEARTGDIWIDVQLGRVIHGFAKNLAKAGNRLTTGTEVPWLAAG
jgi:hypothetical protein